MNSCNWSQMASTQNNKASTSSEIMERKMINPALLITFGSFISFLNFIEIIMIVKLKEKKVYDTALLSLSVSDCMFGLSNIVVPSLAGSSLSRFEELSESSYVLYLVFVLASIFHLIFMAIDRVILVVKPLYHKVMFTKNRACVTIAAIWTITFIISIASFMRYEVTEVHKNVVIFAMSIAKVNITGPVTGRSKPYNNQTTNNDETRKGYKKATNRTKFKNDMQFLLSVCIVSADVLIILCYSIIVFAISIRKKKVHSISERRRRLPIICLSIGATFVLCTLPFAVSKFALGEVKFWGDMILLLNSGMNSIVYYFRVSIGQCQRKNRRQDIPLNECKNRKYGY